MNSRALWGASILRPGAPVDPAEVLVCSLADSCLPVCPQSLATLSLSLSLSNCCRPGGDVGWSQAASRLICPAASRLNKWLDERSGELRAERAPRPLDRAPVGRLAAGARNFQRLIHSSGGCLSALRSARWCANKGRPMYQPAGGPLGPSVALQPAATTTTTNSTRADHHQSGRGDE